MKRITDLEYVTPVLAGAWHQAAKIWISWGLAERTEFLKAQTTFFPSPEQGADYSSSQPSVSTRLGTPNYAAALRVAKQH
jgi:hypothetical protein